jgi:hypothetical protein
LYDLLDRKLGKEYLKQGQWGDAQKKHCPTSRQLVGRYLGSLVYTDSFLSACDSDADLE